MMKWMPINTAPTETPIIVMSLDEEGRPSHIMQGRYFEMIDQWVMTYGNTHTPDPEFWVPIPDRN